MFCAKILQYGLLLYLDTKVNVMWTTLQNEGTRPSVSIDDLELSAPVTFSLGGDLHVHNCVMLGAVVIKWHNSSPELKGKCARN